jgi:sugar/nucleoside kinase (ribokinase family)
MAVPGGPVACFSYLAAASLWTVGEFPAANRVAEVRTIEESVAADGPTVAAVLQALEQPGLLIANDIGEDRSGDQVQRWLRCHQVATIADSRAGIATPQIVVVGDDRHTRTIFPHLPNADNELERVDLTPLGCASFAYIDGFGIIGESAARAIRTARGAGLPLLLNMGGDIAPPVILAALDSYPRLIVQTSITLESLHTAARLATCMQADMKAEWAVVTAGAAGAVAANARRQVQTTAFRADVRHTHCAGAAFSGGLIYGLLHGWSMHDSLDLASASGALRCEREQGEPMPTLSELHSVIRSRQRLDASAA